MKLLLVEDDIEISQMLKSYLEAENYEVICAVDGEEACEKFEKESYSLVFLEPMIILRNHFQYQKNWLVLRQISEEVPNIQSRKSKKS